MKSKPKSSQLLLQPTSNTPYVRMDEATGEFVIAGPSFPDEADAFYTPIRERISRYAAQPAAQTKVEFQLEYLSVASSKALLDIVFSLKRCDALSVIWRYMSEDDAVKEVGEHLSELSGVPFEYEKR